MGNMQEEFNDHVSRRDEEMTVRDAGYISRMLIEASNHHSGLTAELMEGAASEIDLLVDEKSDLQAKVDRLRDQIEHPAAVILELRAERDRYKAALKFYADEDEWKFSANDPHWRLLFNSSSRDGDGFEIAKEALAEAVRP